MAGRAKLFIILFLIGAVWLGVLLRIGLWRTTLKPEGGHLSYTFDGWAEYPVSRHLFLAASAPDDYARGRVYVSITYPFLFFNFLFLAPFHFLLGLPYNVAHNFLPYFYVFCLTLLVIIATKRQLLAISEKNRFLLWLLVFLSIGITITDPLPWTSSFNTARDNPHILAAGSFCYLSIWVFYNRIPKKALLVVGIFLALWAAMYVPAWILAGIFFQRTLTLDRKWILQVVAVCALTGLNIALPGIVSRLAGIGPAGSSFLFRSGLDGSQVYMTNIFQAVYAPTDPRHWPTAFYVLFTALLAVCFHYFFSHKRKYHPLRQALFLLIPYATVSIFLPQLTSIHPYITDLFLFVPATFLMSFWFLQRAFWERLTGKAYVAWLLLAGLILMTNLLTVSQMPRFTYVERKLLPVAAVVVFVSLCLYLGFMISKRFRLVRVGKAK
jgi:hypothetical protein